MRWRTEEERPAGGPRRACSDPPQAGDFTGIVLDGALDGIYSGTRVAHAHTLSLNMALRMYDRTVRTVSHGLDHTGHAEEARSDNKRREALERRGPGQPSHWTIAPLLCQH